MDGPATANRERLFGGYSGRILLVVTTSELLISVGALLLPPLLPAVINDFGITTTQAGSLMTVWLLTLALLTYPGGRLSDGLSQKTVLVAGALIAVVGLIILSTAFTFIMLLAGVAVIGIGRGLFQPASITQLSNVFVTRRGQALGIRTAAFTLSGTLAGGIAIVVLSVGDWRAGFVPIGVCLLAATLIMHVWNRQSYDIGGVALDLRDTGRRLLSIGEIRWLVVTLSIYGFAWNGATTFLPTFLQTSKGLSASAASIGFSGVFLMGAAVQPFAGLLGDRIGHFRAAALASVTCSLGIGAMIVTSSLVVLVASIVMFGIGLAAFWPPVIAKGMGILPVHNRGGDWGAITTIYLATESLGSAAAGLVAERASFDGAYLMLFGCFLTAAGISVWLARRE